MLVNAASRARAARILANARARARRRRAARDKRPLEALTTRLRADRDDFLLPAELTERLRRLRLATCFFLLDDFLANLPVDFFPVFFAETALLLLLAAFFFDLACAVIEAPTQITKSITTEIVATTRKFFLIFSSLF
ncbi:MAG: hypothetical protein KA368_12780 [Acidobacteria bacterium]|nr:hypothetical protein [Acidobacteriota bacterium]